MSYHFPNIKLINFDLAGNLKSFPININQMKEN